MLKSEKKMKIQTRDLGVNPQTGETDPENLAEFRKTRGQKSDFN
jgi:hypothetical protein